MISPSEAPNQQVADWAMVKAGMSDLMLILGSSLREEPASLIPICVIMGRGKTVIVNV